MRKREIDEAARARLRARLRQILARYLDAQDRIGEALGEREIEEVERAAQIWDRNVLSALTDHDLATIADVLAGLRRVAEGTYGRCVECGGAIAPARLGALPEASRCIDCAATPQTLRRHAS